MQIFFILALLVVLGFVVYALIRGLHAFANLEPDNVDENGIPKSLARQNEMMFARVKWQAVAIVIALILLALGGAASS